MSGFAPRGHYPFRDIREIMGADTLGAWLAAGDFIAHAVSDDGEILPLPLSVWRTADAAQIMADGDLAPPEGGSPVPLLITSRRLGDLIAVMEARERIENTKELHLVPANDGSSFGTVAEESSARRAFKQFIALGERLTRDQAYQRLKADHPGLSERGFRNRIWDREAPPEWRLPGRR